jgi:class 3 adenylate cyclase
MSQTMGPDDNFRFLNSYLRRMGPVVRRHDGVVDRYLGDGILALFPGDPCQAMEAAIDLQKALIEYNGHRAQCGYPAIEVGIGIHRAPVLLGTIGENNRMEPTMISEAVNAASGLEGLTRKLGKDILVSGETVEALGIAALRFDLEYLHDEAIQGLSRPLRVYGLEPLAG